MQQQKMKKNKLQYYSKNESSTILASTDETFSQNQPRLLIDPTKKNLIEKIKNLEQALNRTNQEYSALIQKQSYLMNVIHEKNLQLKLMNSEVGQPHLHNHIRNNEKRQRKHCSTVNGRNSTQAQILSKQQNFCKRETRRSQATQNVFLNKSRTPINNEKMKKSFKDNFEGQIQQFTRSYLKKNGSRQITTERKIINNKYEMKFESIEQIWNNQRRENKKTYSKHTKKAQNQLQY